METISKDEFLKVYNSFPPNKFIKFCYKYFSKDTENKDMHIKKIVWVTLVSLFAAGFLSTAFNLSRTITGPITITYGICLTLLVISLFSASFMNNARISKIRKALGGISKEDYNRLVKLYESV